MKRERSRLYHRDGCAGVPANLHDYTGSQGDRLRGCKECGRFVVLATTETQPTPATREPLPMLEPPDPLKPLLPAEFYYRPPEPIAAPAPEPISPHRTGWRCRDHHRRWVDRRGRGCPDCAQERLTKRREPKPPPIEYTNPQEF